MISLMACSAIKRSIALVSAAVKTRKPFALRLSAMTSRIPGSSSTTRMGTASLIKGLDQQRSARAPDCFRGISGGTRREAGPAGGEIREKQSSLQVRSHFRRKGSQ